MWYRISASKMEDTTRKVLETIATNLVRHHLLSLELNKPSDQDVAHGVSRIMKDIERQHGSITKAALSTKDVNLKPLVDASISKLKW